MGNKLNIPAKMTDSPIDISRDYFDIEGVNGYILHDKYIPEEIILLILSYVDPKSVLHNCRRVCKLWCNIIDRDVWRLKCERKKIDIRKLNDSPWFVYFFLCTKEFFNRNLIKNACGEENFQHWEILCNGGDEWTVEKPPQGVASDFPKETASEEVLKNNSCFTTSFNSCTKRQLIDLKAIGAIPFIMNNLCPLITVSEWFTGREDCRSTYELKVTLLDKNEDALEIFEINEQVGGENMSAWKQVSHVFDDYPKGVQYVEFHHGGQDSQFWAGHYGSKMTGASVVLSLH